MSISPELIFTILRYERDIICVVRVLNVKNLGFATFSQKPLLKSFEMIVEGNKVYHLRMMSFLVKILIQGLKVNGIWGHGIIRHWNCDFGTGYVISVPQIIFTDSAKSYIGRKDR